jgi:hypothetical protein
MLTNEEIETFITIYVKNMEVGHHPTADGFMELYKMISNVNAMTTMNKVMQNLPDLLKELIELRSKKLCECA